MDPLRTRAGFGQNTQQRHRSAGPDVVARREGQQGEDVPRGVLRSTVTDATFSGDAAGAAASSSEATGGGSDSRLSFSSSWCRKGAHDDSTVAWLLAHSVAERQLEEEQAREAAKLREFGENVATKVQRLEDEVKKFWGWDLRPRLLTSSVPPSCSSRPPPTWLKKMKETKDEEDEGEMDEAKQNVRSIRGVKEKLCYIAVDDTMMKNTAESLDKGKLSNSQSKTSSPSESSVSVAQMCGSRQASSARLPAEATTRPSRAS